MSLMTNEEIEATLIHGQFWSAFLEEPYRVREDVFANELKRETERLGAGKILFILKDYAERNRGNSPI